MNMTENKNDTAVVRQNMTAQERTECINDIIAILSELSPKQLEYVIREAANVQIQISTLGAEAIHRPYLQLSEQYPA